jgi:hypothetical protein
MDYAWLTMTYNEADQSGMYLWQNDSLPYSVVYHEFPHSWEAAVVHIEMGLDDMGRDSLGRDTEDLPFNWIFG